MTLQYDLSEKKIMAALVSGLLQIELLNCVDAAIYVDEDDIATYTIKTIDDPRTLNKTVYIRPPDNILSQRQVVRAWEKLIGKQLKKTSISEVDFINKLKELKHEEQVGLGHYYHVCYEGCLTNFEIGEEGEEASQLYSEVTYTRVTDYLKRYL